MDSVRGLIFRYRIWWHVLFWVVWYFFYTFTYSTGVFTKTQLIQNLYLLPVRMGATYLLLYWILPGFLFKRKYLMFIVLIILNAVAFGLAIWFVLDVLRGTPRNLSINIIRPIVLNYQIPATAMAIYMFKRWFLIQQYTLNLEKEKLEAELKFLRSQIQPHFLFNTLNNLYALTLKKSESAPDVVIKLSNLLEYSLYSEIKDEVPLNEELNLLKGYTDLEMLRFGKRLILEFIIPEKADGYLIAPLVLLPFVENSFKHGASRVSDSPFINITIGINNNKLRFVIINSYRIDDYQEQVTSERIGLKNVRRRLELLYPGKHKLDIWQENGIFGVDLEMELRKHV